MPVPVDETEEDNAATSSMRSEADLRGTLSNDSLTEDEIKLIEEDRARAEDAAKLRDEDYQLAYAIDILKGLHALGPQIGVDLSINGGDAPADSDAAAPSGN